MASLTLDDIPEQAAAPKALTLDDIQEQAPAMKLTLDAIEEPKQAKALTLDDVPDAPFTQMPSIRDVLGVGVTPVKAALQALEPPLQGEVGLAIRGLDVVVPGIKKELIPDGSSAYRQVFPDRTYVDVGLFLADKYTGTADQYMAKELAAQEAAIAARAASGRGAKDQAQAIDLANAISGPDKAAQMLKLDTFERKHKEFVDPDWAVFKYAALHGAAAGLGVVANLWGDPLRLSQLGQLSRASQARRMAGDVTASERSLISLRKPFATEPSLEVSAAPIQKAWGWAADTKPGRIVGRAIDAFDYRTGYPDIDLQDTIWRGKKIGETQALLKEFDALRKARAYTPDEKRLAARLTEATPNYAVGNAKAAETLDGLMRAELPTASKGLNVAIAPERLDTLIADVIARKQKTAETLAKIKDRGYSIPELEKYMPHKARALKVLDLLKVKMAGMSLQEGRIVSRRIKGGGPSTFNEAALARKLEGTVEEANAQVFAKTGVPEFFMEDPFAAGLLYDLKAAKFLRDDDLLTAIEKYGVRPGGNITESMLKENDYLPFASGAFGNKPFAGKTLIIKGEDGATQRVHYKGLWFPRDIVDKLGYRIIPKEVGSFSQFLDGYNNYFRNVALMKADYYGQNYLENMFKNYSLGTEIGDYATARNILKAVPSNKASVEYALRKEIDDLGVLKGGQFFEGVDDIVGAGHRLMYDKTTAKKMPFSLARQAVGDAVRQVHVFGAKGENITRAALYVSLRRRGYKPEMAALETEKFLFDFSVNSPATDMLRRYYSPFIQAAVKTAYVTPELVGKKPAAYNFLNNTLGDAIGRAFHDPLRAAAIQDMLPNSEQNRDRVAGPLLAGNSHVFAAVKNSELFKNNNTRLLVFSPEIGPGILNRFAIWNKDVSGGALQGSPLISAFIEAFTGKDLYMGKEIYPMYSLATEGEKLNQAMVRSIDNAMPLPGVWKIVKNHYGISDPRYFEPATISMMNSQLGQFAKVINLDKEFVYRMMALNAARKDLSVQLIRVAAKEFQGRTFAKTVAGSPILSAVQQQIEPMTSIDVFEKLIGRQKEMQTGAASLQFVSGSLSATEYAALIKSYDKAAKDLNETYRTARQRYLQMAKEIGNTDARNNFIMKIPGMSDDERKAAWSQALPEPYPEPEPGPAQPEAQEE